jgi:hypothetical protein
MRDTYVAQRDSDREWWDKASCARGYSEWWDTDMHQHEATLTLNNVKAVVMCVQCPVRNECLADALKHGGEHTIRAGYTPKQQNELIKNGHAWSRVIRIVEKMLTLSPDDQIVAEKSHEVLRGSAKRVNGKWIDT